MQEPGGAVEEQQQEPRRIGGERLGGLVGAERGVLDSIPSQREPAT
jgi:hypothetical protein